MAAPVTTGQVARRLTAAATLPMTAVAGAAVRAHDDQVAGLGGGEVQDHLGGRALDEAVWA